MNRLLPIVALAGLFFAVSAPSFSQSPSKRPLKHQDYAIWRSIGEHELSADGEWASFTLIPQEGNGEVVARRLTDGKEFRHTRGSAPAAPATPAASRGRAAPKRSAQIAFASGVNHLVFTIYPPRVEKEKTKAPPLTNPGTSTSLGLMDLSTGRVTVVPRVRSFQVSKEGSPMVAYLRDPAPARESPKGPISRDTTGAPPPTSVGELVLHRLSDGKQRILSNVSEYSLTKDGELLIYARADSSPQGTGVFAIDTKKEGLPLVIRGGHRCSRITWDEKQTQLAFVQTPPNSPGSAAKKEKSSDRSAGPLLCHWKRPKKTPVETAIPSSPVPGDLALSLNTLRAAVSPARDLVSKNENGGQAEKQVSDQSDLSFSLDGEHLYYSVSSPARPTPATSTEQPLVELWHYKDDFIPTMQKVRYNARPTFRAVFHLSDSMSRQISDENLTQAQPMPKGDWVVGFDDHPYRILVGSREAANLGDTYLINGRTGERRLIDRKQPSPPSASPEGKYLMQFDGKDWISISVPEGKRVNLTSKLGVPFTQEWYDQPSPAPAHGLAGWMDQDRHVLLYDRYDIWMIAADGSSTKNITGGHGRKTSTQYRIVRLDPEERAFNPNKALLLQAENETTRDTGFCHATVAGGVPRKLIMGPRSHGTPVKATRSDRLLLTVQSFHEFPDLYSADSQFRDLQRVSDANPQKAEYQWGKAELLRYKNSDGLPLDAILIKPDNFDPKRKYPMIVYIYERLSQNIHRFVPPSPGNNINPSYYASNGYLVLMPDIAYTIGHPGQSCVKCVLPAIQAVADRGFLDENAVGIQGHSWGGYQTAYLITQTTRFKAAAAGALVGNMTSAYGGIRLGTGLPRQFQYERTQSRIGGTLWELPSRFLENSPIFHADRIKTPLLMLHNDRDDAVPWQQGIEFFLALRRLGKEVYMFNYPGELHGLRQRVNQKDYTVRLQEFFDHHLKGAPRPDWMAKGIPYAPPPGENPAPAGGGRRGRTTGSTPTAPQEPE